MITVKCSICGEEFKVNRKTYNAFKYHGWEFTCDDCEDFLMGI